MQQISPWHLQIYIGCLIGAIAFSWQIFKKTNLIGGLLFFYLLMNSVQTYFYPVFTVPNMGPVVNGMIPNLAAMSAVWILMVTFPFVILPKDKNKYVDGFFGIVALLDSVSVLFRLGIDQYRNSGVQLNPAQDGTLIACLLPLVYYSKSWFKWPITMLMMLAIVKTKASTPLVGLAVFLCVAVWFSRYRIFAIIGPIVTALIGLWMQGYVALTSSDGRLNYIWPLIMKYWKEHLNKTFGAGSGSFFMYGPAIEINFHGFGYMNPVYIWLHNEWLQILFEFGIVGLIMAALFYIITLIKTYSRPMLFSSLLVYGVTASFQMPLRQFVSAFFLMFILKMAYEEANV